MSFIDVMTGNKAVAYGVKLARVETLPSYPITPQTSISEYLAEFVSNGKMKAEFIHSEGEHSAMAMAIGASISGSRVFTSTSSQGLAYMHECVAQATGYRAPIVMAVANRRVGSIWSLGADYTDVMPEVNLGWIVTFVESNQEALDMVLQLYKIAENRRVLLPAMLNLDGFYLSFSYERVSVPDQRIVDGFLPKYEPLYAVDPTISTCFPNVFPPPKEGLTAYTREYEEILNDTRKIILEVGKDFFNTFGRGYGGLIEKYQCDDADFVLITVGSMSTAAKRAVDRLRRDGTKAGLIRIRSYRPFPHEELLDILRDIKAVGIVDRSVSHGTGKGPIYLDVKATVYNLKDRLRLYNFIAGIGGENISIENFKNMFEILKDINSKKEIHYIENSIPTPNRRVKVEEISNFRDKLIFSGGEGCPGCTIPLLIKQVLDIVGPNISFSFPPHCAFVNFSCGVLNVPTYIANFAAGAAYASGVYRSYRLKGKADKIVSAVWAGDGGTYDIGFQSLSAAAEREESILFMCCDNEAYMNTGVQRSGSTPVGAFTTTTPIGTVSRGKKEEKKNMPLIMSLHRIPYIATGAPSHVADIKKKIEKAKNTVLQQKGLSYLHFIQPCPTGWYFDTCKSIEVSRLAVLTGAWPLYEIDNGKLNITYRPSKLRPIEDYVRFQGRFKHLSAKEVGMMQDNVNSQWQMLIQLEKLEKLPWYL